MITEQQLQEYINQHTSELNVLTKNLVDFTCNGDHSDEEFSKKYVKSLKKNRLHHRNMIEIYNRLLKMNT